MCLTGSHRRTDAQGSEHPVAEDDGSAKLRGNPHASRPLDRLRHVAGRVDVGVEDETAAVADVHPVHERLRPVGLTPASAASLGGAARVDEDRRPAGACSLVAQHVPQQRPLREFYGRSVARSNAGGSCAVVDGQVVDRARGASWTSQHPGTDRNETDVPIERS